MVHGQMLLKKILIVIAAAVIMPASLVLTALIPKGSIRTHSLESAQYLYDGELFGCVKEGIEGSRIDRYADAILLNIAYNLDSEYPIESVALSAYYFTPDHEENENYLMAVRDDPGINRQYLRYWHGSIVFVRPLLTILNVRNMYILNAVVLAALLLTFCIMMARRKEYTLIIALIVSLVISRAWYVPLSLEYTWTFMIMLICSIIAAILCQKELGEYYAVFFAITGMATSFVDFLTTETITLLMPLLVIMWLTRGRYEEMGKPGLGSFIKRRDFGMVMQCSLSWLAGYVCMWVSKWIMCSLVMKENALPYVTEHVTERLGGEIGVGEGEFIAGAVTRNIGCLFPLGYGAIGVIGFMALILFALYRGFVYRQDHTDRGFIALAAMIAFAPWLRYLVLHNHSYIHFFFTFRAQAAAVMAVVLITARLTEKDRASGSYHR
ncbi:MAG: hypothetical protein K6E49_07820 [Lachnospiraceae bacterium]|nr:hypothetical protein [Lachnospiraceae bacterium]